MLRLKKVLMALFFVAVLALALAAVAVAAGTPFAGAGSWENNDGDGSHQTMRIESLGKKAAILWFDDGGTVCKDAPEDPPDNPVFVVGSGKTNSAGQLEGSMNTFCVTNPVRVGNNGGEFDFVFSYPHPDFGGDTLAADGGQCWYRAGGNPGDCEP